MFTKADYMTVAISRMLVDNETVFHGVSSPIPMCAINLARKTHAKNLIYVNIPGGVNGNMPKYERTSTAGSDLLEGANSYFPLSEVFDLSMRGKLDVAFLSGIQFDNKGNVNASVIGDYKKPKVRLPGGAGSAVLIPTAKKPIIWRTKHDKRTFVEKCDFITTKGNLHAIVTPLCIFKMKNGEIYLDKLMPDVTLEDVLKNTGFMVKYEKVEHMEEPTKEEIRWLNMIDPSRVREMEFS